MDRFSGTIIDKMEDVLVIEVIHDSKVIEYIDEVPFMDDAFEFIFCIDGDVVGAVTWHIMEIGENRFDNVWGDGEDLLIEYVNTRLLSC